MDQTTPVNFCLTDVRTIEGEYWLRELRRRDGDDLANSTKAKTKIRNVMSVIFNHAIRYEWLEKNPITLVRQSAERRSLPPVLEPDEVQRLLDQLDNPFRVMVLLDVTTGFGAVSFLHCSGKILISAIC